MPDTKPNPKHEHMKIEITSSQALILAPILESAMHATAERGTAPDATVEEQTKALREYRDIEAMRDNLNRAARGKVIGW